MSRPRPPYPETLKPFTWPTPGVRTWQAPERSYFGTCSAAGTADDHVCPVGVYKVNGRVLGCDCICHQARRARLQRSSRPT